MQNFVVCPGCKHKCATAREFRAHRYRCARYQRGSRESSATGKHVRSVRSRTSTSRRCQRTSAAVQVHKCDAAQNNEASSASWLRLQEAFYYALPDVTGDLDDPNCSSFCVPISSKSGDSGADSWCALAEHCFCVCNEASRRQKLAIDAKAQKYDSPVDLAYISKRLCARGPHEVSSEPGDVEGAVDGVVESLFGFIVRLKTNVDAFTNVGPCHKKLRSSGRSSRRDEVCSNRTALRQPIQGFIVASTFSVPAQTFRWNSHAPWSGITAQERVQNLQHVDASGSLGASMQRSTCRPVRCRNGNGCSVKGQCWDEIAEIVLMGALHCGYQLMIKMLRHLFGQGFRFAVVNAIESAVSFYEKFGFVRVGAVLHCFDDDSMPELAFSDADETDSAHVSYMMARPLYLSPEVFAPGARVRVFYRPKLVPQSIPVKKKCMTDTNTHHSSGYKSATATVVRVSGCQQHDNRSFLDVVVDPTPNASEKGQGRRRNRRRTRVGSVLRVRGYQAFHLKVVPLCSQRVLSTIEPREDSTRWELSNFEKQLAARQLDDASAVFASLAAFIRAGDGRAKAPSLDCLRKLLRLALKQLNQHLIIFGLGKARCIQLTSFLTDACTNAIPRRRILVETQKFQAIANQLKDRLVKATYSSDFSLCPGAHERGKTITSSSGSTSSSQSADAAYIATLDEHQAVAVTVDGLKPSRAYEIQFVPQAHLKSFLENNPGLGVYHIEKKERLFWMLRQRFGQLWSALKKQGWRHTPPRNLEVGPGRYLTPGVKARQCSEETLGLKWFNSSEALVWWVVTHMPEVALSVVGDR